MTPEKISPLFHDEHSKKLSDIPGSFSSNNGHKTINGSQTLILSICYIPFERFPNVTS